MNQSHTQVLYFYSSITITKNESAAKKYVTKKKNPLNFLYRITSILLAIVVMYIVLVSPAEILRFTFSLLKSHDSHPTSVQATEIWTTAMEVDLYKEFFCSLAGVKKNNLIFKGNTHTFPFCS